MRVLSARNDKLPKMLKPSDEPLTISRRPTGAVCQVALFSPSRENYGRPVGRLLAIFAPLFAAFRQKWSLQRPPLLPLTCLPAGVTPPRVIFVAMLFFVALGDSVAKIRDAGDDSFSPRSRFCCRVANFEMRSAQS
jgi:hypothetical protein